MSQDDDPPTPDSHDTVVDRGPRLPTHPTNPPRPRTPSPPPPEKRYQLGTEIAHGGMGRVIEATDTLLGRTVAVKQARILDGDALRRFERETRITARLEHPSIVPVYDAGRLPDGSPFYVMRKVSGQPLSKLVKVAETPGARLALLPHVAAAANAVAHAHRRSIVHRDLKPSNILVGELGETIVIDWGIAKVIGEPDDDLPATPPPDPAGSLRTAYGTVIGTPGYMAPEQIRCEPVDARADVYALGATLYHVLAGHAPHHAGSGDTIMEAQLEAPPESLARSSGIPPELAAIVDTALSHDLAIRYRDAGLLAEDLQRFLTGQLVAAHTYSRGARVVRFVRRNRVPVAISLAAAIALVAGGTVAFAKVISERDRADDEARLATQRQRDAETATATAQAATAEAMDRADRLVVQQALSLVATNPTAAVALVKPLVARGHWREARDVGLLAHQHGVAWRAPSSLFTRGLDLAPDGIHAVTCGSDGALRMLDLPRRVTTELWHPRPTDEPTCYVVFAAGGSRLAIAHDDRLELTDLAGTIQHTVALSARPAELHAVGDHVAVWTAGHAVVWVDARTGDTSALDGAGEPVQLAESPDGRRLAIASSSGVWIADAGKPPRQLAKGDAWSIAWADDATVLVSLGNDMKTLRIADGSTVESWPGVGRMYLAHATGAHRYFEGTTATLYDKSRALTGPSDQHTMKMFDAARDATIFVHGDEVLARTPQLDIHLRAPSEGIGEVMARKSSPFVITAAPGMVLVWNLDDVLPRLATQEPMNNIIFAADKMIVEELPDRRVMIDLETFAQKVLDGPMLVATVTTPMKTRLVGMDLDHQVFSFDIDTGSGRRIATGVSMLGRGGEGVLFGFTDGHVELYDPVADRAHTVGPEHPGSPLAALSWNGRWAVALLEDGTVRRIDVATGAAETHRPRKGSGAIVIRDTGDVFYAADSTIYRWSAAGATEEWTTLPHPVHGFEMLDEHHGVIATSDTAGYVVDLDTKAPATSTFRVGESRARLVQGTGMMTIKEPTGLHLLDPLTGVEGPLLDQVRQTTLEASVSPDLRWLYINSMSGVLLWRFEVPTDAASTARYLDAMTNATAERGPAALDWR